MLLRCTLRRVRQRQRMPRRSARAFFASDADGVTEIAATVSNGAVTVTATKQVKTKVANVLGFEQIAVGARSTAAIESEGAPICVLGLSHTASPAVSFAATPTSRPRDARSTAIRALRMLCRVKARRRQRRPLSAPSGEHQGHSSHGQVALSGKGRSFASLVAPVTTGCDYSSSNATSVSPNGTKSFAPGTYCATLDIKGTATLAPGVYVLKNGLNIAAQGAASGTGVTFYLTGSNAGFTINGGGTLSLSAPTSGSYAGVLIYQDRTANVGERTSSTAT